MKLKKNFSIFVIILFVTLIGFLNTQLKLEPSSKVGLRTGASLSRLGLKTGDQIIYINSKKVESYLELKSAIEQTKSSLPLNIDYVSHDQNIKYSIAEPPLNSLENNNFYKIEDVGIENPAFYIQCVKYFSLAENLKLAPYDRILLINGTPLPHFLDHEKQFEKTLNTLKTSKHIQVSIVRDGKVMQLELKNINFSQNEFSKPDIEQLYQFLGLLPFSKKIIFTDLGPRSHLVRLALLLKGWNCEKTK